MILFRKKLIKKLKKIQKEKREEHRELFSKDTDYQKGLYRGFEDGNDNAYNYIISLIEEKKI